MTRKKKMRIRILSLLMALCLLVSMSGNALAETISEMEARHQELEQEKTELESKLEAYKNDEAKKLDYQQALQGKIDVVKKQIDSAREDINQLNAHIKELTIKLDKSQQEVQSTIEKFKERLKSLYKAGDVGTLEILLSSNSFSDFTMRSKLVETMTVHDQQLMDKIRVYMDNTRSERKDCEDSKKEVAKLQKQLEKQQDELDALYAENQQAIAELKTAQENTRKLIADNEAELEANDQKMQAAIEAQRRQEQQNNQGGMYPTGGGGVEGFNPIWPLPGVSYVSCYYGGYEGHRGMDIAGSYGTEVVAAESGTVIAANNYDSWGDSWGYYVLIYHNATFTTRYAHLSSLAVGYGEYVEAGTVVGYEGDTGNVTGPHLHFEVYENGSRVDPMIYL